MLIVICLCLLMLMVIVSFCVDIAYMQLTRTELRAATDAAARAAAEALSREQSEVAARQAAKDVAARNEVASKSLELRDADIVFGRIDMRSGLGAFRPGETPPNAVQVMGLRTRESASGAVPLFFGKIFNFPDFQPTQSAVAANLDRDIALVVDHSGSMLEENRWKGLEEAIDVFLDELDRTPYREIMSLSGYSTSARRIEPLTTDTRRIRRAFKRLSPDGFTNIGGGLKMGSDSLEQDPGRRPYAAKTIILLTDGWHNVGTDPISAAEIAKERGHVVHTITFGRDCDEELMREVARITGGEYYHAQDNEQLLEVFREIALTLPIVFAQ
jgi:uncharacterized protein YegL